MKDGVRVINLSRGDLVNNADMAKALESGKVACYLTDFPTSEIMNMKNVIAIPHLGASTPESEDNCAIMAVGELIDYLENGNIKNSVNFPDVQNPKGGDESVCVIHNNIPNILAQISMALSKEGLNIENLSSRSKKDVAYSVFEINGKCPDFVVEKLKTVDGIICVNIINNR
jgi:D-3-phosphoglycerate dehydrogenase